MYVLFTRYLYFLLKVRHNLDIMIESKPKVVRLNSYLLT